MRYYLIAWACLVWMNTYAQTDTSWTISEKQALPAAVSNNAVTQAYVNGQWYVYSFGGIGAGLTYADIHLNAYRYNVTNDNWTALPDLPDTLGKIAAAASNVKGKIYIIGGYHVFANGTEVSSDKVHVFDPELNDYVADGAPVPIPVDDQVQAVWRDSLIYVIGGWSNTAHTAAVQIYNPATDTWMAGTPLPVGTDYKAFGASGTIIGDKIYYMGGARPGLNFPVAPELRIGTIDPNQPDSIVWSRQVIFGSAGYRMGAATLGDDPIWLGGSMFSYNYNGAAYDGSGIVSPTRRVMIYDVSADSVIFQDTAMVPVMDLRGVAEVGEGQYIICGGIGNNVTVSDKTWLIGYNQPVSSVASIADWAVQIYPNPATDFLYINSPTPIGRLALYDLQGKAVINISNRETSLEIDLHGLKRGIYLLYAQDVTGKMLRRKVVVR